MKPFKPESIFNVSSTTIQIALILLKLFNVVDWSWIWILSPLWISFGLVLLLFIIGFIFYFIKKKTV